MIDSIKNKIAQGWTWIKTVLDVDSKPKEEISNPELSEDDNTKGGA